MINDIRKHFRLAAAASAVLAALAAGHAVAGSAGAASASASATAAAHAQPTVFARVGDAVITYDDYNAAFNAAVRNKFYHGKPPENEIAALQREVGDQLVARALLLREAKQRGLKPDTGEIQRTIATYDQRYANSEQWKKNRPQMVPALTARLEEESLLTQIESTVRAVPKPAPKEVKAYYAAHPEKFTEPEQLRVSVILLKVEPSSPKAVWVKADEEAQGLVKKLHAGADFASLAKLHSGDASAQQGGDMGYLHNGMLPDGTQAVLNAMKPGDVSNPVQLLEGMAVFKLTDRKTAKLNNFEAVQSRAGDLLQRDQADAAWKKFVAELKKKTPAHIDQSQFLPLAEQSGSRSAPKQ